LCHRRPTNCRSDLWADVSRLSFVGHRSLTPQHGSSASPALLLPITCTSPSSRQLIRAIPLGLGFLRNPSPSALRWAPAPVIVPESTDGVTPFPFRVWRWTEGENTPPGPVWGACRARRKSPAQGPVPFWLQRVSLLRWFNLTTVSFSSCGPRSRRRPSCLADNREHQ